MPLKPRKSKGSVGNLSRSSMLSPKNGDERKRSTASTARKSVTSHDGSEVRLRLEIDQRRCEALETQIADLLTTERELTSAHQAILERHNETITRHHARQAFIKKEHQNVQLSISLANASLADAYKTLNIIKSTVDDKLVMLAKHFVPRTGKVDFDIPWDIFGGSVLNAIRPSGKEKSYLNNEGTEPSREGNLTATHYTTVPKEATLTVPFQEAVMEPKFKFFLRTRPSKVFNRGELIVQLGQQPTEMYFITTGMVNVILRDRAVATLREGDFFGEMSLLLPTMRTATVVAVCRTEVAVVSKEGLFSSPHRAVISVISRLVEKRARANAMSLLHHNSVLRPYANNEIFQTHICRDMYTVVREAHQPLIEQNTEGDVMYFITTGVFEIWINESLVGNIRDGFAGEVSLLTGTYRTASVSCSAPISAIALTTRGFNKIANLFPALFDTIAGTARERQVMSQTFKEFYRNSLFHNIVQNRDFFNIILLSSERLKLAPRTHLDITAESEIYHVAEGMLELRDSDDVRVVGQHEMFTTSKTDTPDSVVTLQASSIVYRISQPVIKQLDSTCPSEMPVIYELLSNPKTVSRHGHPAAVYLEQVREQLAALQDPSACYTRGVDNITEILSGKYYETKCSVPTTRHIPRPPSECTNYFQRSRLK